MYVRISNGSSTTNIPIHPARYEYGKASMPRCKLNTSGVATITLTPIFTRLEMRVIFKSPMPLKIVITHEMIFKILRFKIIYFFMHFNSVLVYTIVMKRYVTYPDWVEKFRSPGHTIKKTKQGYGLYSCTSKYVPGGKPKSIQTYLGKITPDGFIPKSVVSKHPVYVEFGLSHFIISSFKRDLIRSSFRATDDTVYLGVVQYIFGSCQDIFLSSCFLTYKNKESLCKYRDSISATRIKTISNKIARLMESYFDAQEIAVLSQILKLAVVDVTSDHIYYPTIPEEVVDIIERNGLHYE